MPAESYRLDRLDRAVKRRTLTTADIDVLRAAITSLRGTGRRHPDLGAALSSLKTIDTQLSRLATRLGDARLEPASFRSLPAPVRRAVLARLDAAGARIARCQAASIATAGIETGTPAGDDPTGDLAFHCAGQHRRCCDRRPAGRLWCHIALAVCLVRTLLPLMHRPAAATDPKPP